MVLVAHCTSERSQTKDSEETMALRRKEDEEERGGKGIDEEGWKRETEEEDKEKSSVGWKGDVFSRLLQAHVVLL